MTVNRPNTTRTTFTARSRLDVAAIEASPQQMRGDQDDPNPLQQRDDHNTTRGQVDPAGHDPKRQHGADDPAPPRMMSPPVGCIPMMRSGRATPISSATAARRSCGMLMKKPLP